MLPLAPQASASANSATSARANNYYFFGAFCAGALGAGAAGFPPGADDCGTDAGADAGLCAGFGALAGADCFALSRTVLPTDDPAFRVARIDSESDVIIKTTAETVVAFDNSVAEPRGPKAVCEPIPPKAPARSAALPLCRSTTMIRKTHTRT